MEQSQKAEDDSLSDFQQQSQQQENLQQCNNSQQILKFSGKCYVSQHVSHEIVQEVLFLSASRLLMFCDNRITRVIELPSHKILEEYQTKNLLSSMKLVELWDENTVVAAGNTVINFHDLKRQLSISQQIFAHSSQITAIKKLNQQAYDLIKLLTAGAERVLKIWNVSKKICICRFDLQVPLQGKFVISQNSVLTAFVSAKQQISFLGRSSNRLLLRINLFTDNGVSDLKVQCLAFLAGRQTLFLAGTNCSLILASAKRKCVLANIDFAGNRIFDILQIEHLGDSHFMLKTRFGIMAVAEAVQRGEGNYAIIEKSVFSNEQQEDGKILLRLPETPANHLRLLVIDKQGLFYYYE